MIGAIAPLGQHPLHGVVVLIGLNQFNGNLILLEQEAYMGLLNIIINNLPIKVAKNAKCHNCILDATGKIPDVINLLHLSL